MVLKILFVEDDDGLRENLKQSFDKETISGYLISAEAIGNFEKGMELIKEVDYDIVILDLFKDKGIKDEEAGLKILNEIRKHVFIPVIFYTGHAYKISDLVSEIVGVVSKGDGIEKLSSEIKRTITSRLALLKNNINDHIRESLRKYFWETVDTDKRIFVPQKNDFSLGYLLLRRIANSLSKEKIKELLGDDKITIDKAHPMEFYIYPTNHNHELELGEILKNADAYFVNLTPSCDLVERKKGKRKTEKVLLAKATRLSDTEDFKKYIALKNKENKSKQENEQLSNLVGILRNWATNKQGDKDRFFFLPSTPFLENLTVDFQDNTMLAYSVVKNFHRVAKLDDPFAQAMLSTFIRYYNRIGYPDLDTDYVISSIS